ncbi:MAG TPA: glutaredoxin family protein [Steroidobacteraceae bacterium]|nr:glutaredoxin family protein [Steroidobacteraceae bacterium]HQW09499.1 glutaredoxin family protein [Steroidobacteraceae bacterium]HQX46779.1 glutaredoxin family protein [Steroidobacteraceae bacterium]HQX77710.1 glutaredoxin family protein [Steroidobacteraceae bacterium]HQZ79952.1 glutaredoxin family protein [Steroidobacteraceae bacterium]
MAKLELLSREGCGLCEAMREALEGLRAELTLPPVAIIDIDSDPVLQRRFILEIPVLRLDGVVICFGKLDLEALRRHLQVTSSG